MSIEAFLAAYVATTKEAIRQNRANVAERLGFLGRVVHGSESTNLASYPNRPPGRKQPITLRSHPRESEYAKLNEHEKSEIIALLESRTQVSIENIREFILDLDERDYIEFLYPSDPDFAEELSERAPKRRPYLRP